MLHLFWNHSCENTILDITVKCKSNYTNSKGMIFPKLVSYKHLILLPLLTPYIITHVLTPQDIQEKKRDSFCPISALKPVFSKQALLLVSCARQDIVLLCVYAQHAALDKHLPPFRACWVTWNQKEQSSKQTHFRRYVFKKQHK